MIPTIVRRTWEEGFAPQFCRQSLEALAEALRSDNPQLLQGATCSPPPLQCVQEWPVEAACPIGYAAAAMLGGIDTATVGETEEQFAKFCFECDQRLGEPAGCRHFLLWWDDTPRDEARIALLELVEASLVEDTAMMDPIPTIWGAI